MKQHIEQRLLRWGIQLTRLSRSNPHHPRIVPFDARELSEEDKPGVKSQQSALRSSTKSIPSRLVHNQKLCVGYTNAREHMTP